jgi:hypothetical protein
MLKATATSGLLALATINSDYIASLTTSCPTNLTGFIKGNGSVLSADNSTYYKSGDSPSFLAETITGASGLTLGTKTTANIPGYIDLISAGANSAYVTTIKAGTQTGTANYQLPLARPTGSGQFLTATNTDPSVMSWGTSTGTNYWSDDSAFLYPTTTRGIKVSSSYAPIRLNDRAGIESMLAVNVIDGPDTIDNSSSAAFKFGFLYQDGNFEGSGFMVQAQPPGYSSWDNYTIPLYAFTNGGCCLNYPQSYPTGRTVIGDYYYNSYSDAQLHVANNDGDYYILRLVTSGGNTAMSVDDSSKVIIGGSLQVGAGDSISQLHIDSASLPSGTLVSPPAGLYSGDVWKDTTTSATHPILRIKN